MFHMHELPLTIATLSANDSNLKNANYVLTLSNVWELNGLTSFTSFI